MTEVDIAEQGRLNLNGHNPRDIINTKCPIDGTRLVAQTGYDFHHYKCVGCGATYSYGASYSWQPKTVLDEEARRYLIDVKIRLSEIDDKKAKLEAILALANEKGLAEGI